MPSYLDAVRVCTYVYTRSAVDSTMHALLTRKFFQFEINLIFFSLLFAKPVLGAILLLEIFTALEVVTIYGCL